MQLVLCAWITDLNLIRHEKIAESGREYVSKHALHHATLTMINYYDYNVAVRSFYLWIISETFLQILRYVPQSKF